MTTDVGRCLTARATHASHRANLRCLGLSVGIAIALSGCGSATGNKASHDVRQSVAADADITIWSDPETGCRYFIYSEGFGYQHIGGVTVRFRRDGTADCPASGMSAGTAATPKSGAGLQPASPAPKADAQQDTAHD